MVKRKAHQKLNKNHWVPVIICVSTQMPNQPNIWISQVHPKWFPKAETLIFCLNLGKDSTCMDGLFPPNFISTPIFIPNAPIHRFSPTCQALHTLIPCLEVTLDQVGHEIEPWFAKIKRTFAETWVCYWSRQKKVWDILKQVYPKSAPNLSQIRHL